jgi:hypothetical protein
MKKSERKRRNKAEKKGGRIASTLGQAKYFLRYLPLTGVWGEDLDDPQADMRHCHRPVQ